jgi:glycopeptide antibiotics resistance protein
MEEFGRICRGATLPEMLLARLLKWATVLLILAALTKPFRFENHGHWENIVWVPFSSHNSPLDFAQNLLLFVPFGYLEVISRSAKSRRPVLRATLIAAAISLLGEACQIFIHFRIPAASDVLLNAGGGCIGGLLAKHFAVWPRIGTSATRTGHFNARHIIWRWFRRSSLPSPRAG